MKDQYDRFCPHVQKKCIQDRCVHWTRYTIQTSEGKLIDDLELCNFHLQTQLLSRLLTEQVRTIKTIDKRMDDMRTDSVTAHNAAVSAIAEGLEETKKALKE